jgi:opacity protein-like surface antigen
MNCWKLRDVRNMNHASVAALAVFLNMSATPLVHARDLFQKTTTETGVSVGLGDNFRSSLGGGNVGSDITFLSLMFSRGRVFRELDRGRSLQLTVEGSVSHAKQEHESRRAVGVTPLFLYNFKTTGRITPFAEAGLGLLYTDLDPERFGSRINFTPQAGIGFRYRLTNERSFRISYRFHHISNGGLDDGNRSIDSNFFIFGVSFLH